jgi:hypothetical protein
VSNTTQQLTQLGERSSSSLGNPIVGVDDAAETNTGPEERGQLLPVPGGGVDHVRSQDTADDSDDVVGVSSEGDRLDQELSRGDFTDDGVADGTE